MKPVGDRIIVQREVAPERTPGGIVLPERSKEQPTRGTVVAVGTGRAFDGSTYPLGVKKGDKIIFDGYAGTPIEVDGEDFLVLSEKEILTVL